MLVTYALSGWNILLQDLSNTIQATIKQWFSLQDIEQGTNAKVLRDITGCLMNIFEDDDVFAATSVLVCNLRRFRECLQVEEGDDPMDQIEVGTANDVVSA